MSGGELACEVRMGLTSAGRSLRVRPAPRVIVPGGDMISGQTPFRGRFPRHRGDVRPARHVRLRSIPDQRQGRCW
jgi:hypothetical protein